MTRILFTFAIVVGACTSASTTPTEAISQATTSDLVCWSSPGGDAAGPVAFDESTEQANLLQPFRGHAAAVGDVNGDDLSDLVVGTFADRPAEDYAVRGVDGPNTDRLLVSDPVLTLVEGWSDELFRTSGALFGDLDAEP